MFYHLLKPHMLQTLILSTCIRITSHTYVHMNTYFIPNFLVYLKNLVNVLMDDSPSTQWLLHTGTCSYTQTGLCSLWRCFSIICFNNHENTYLKTSEMAIFVSFALFIVFDFFWVEWDTKILIQIMYFTLKPLTYFFFQSTIFRIN